MSNGEDVGTNGRQKKKFGGWNGEDEEKVKERAE